MTADKSVYSVLKEKAQHMRKEPTETENVLWRFLCDAQLGYKFRRQHIIDSYIVDFACLQKKLIIEVDGKYHLETEQQELDKQREQRLKSLGFTIIRFANEQIIHDTDNTLLTIKQHLQNGKQ